MPKKNSIVFHNRSNFDNHFIIKQLAKEFEKQFTCLGENTEKKHTVTVPKRSHKNWKSEEEITKKYLLMVQDLWQVYHQILSIIFLNLKEFI